MTHLLSWSSVCRRREGLKVLANSIACDDHFDWYDQ